MGLYGLTESDKKTLNEMISQWGRARNLINPFGPRRRHIRGGQASSSLQLAKITTTLSYPADDDVDTYQAELVNDSDTTMSFETVDDVLGMEGLSTTAAANFDLRNCAPWFPVDAIVVVTKTDKGGTLAAEQWCLVSPLHWLGYHDEDNGKYKTISVKDGEKLTAVW